MTALDRLIARLGDVPVTTAERAVKAKSRDFFWYSPVLKRKLNHISADLVVTPRTRDDIIATLAACHDLDIPVTPRGAGTGNYGQAMPLAGGVVLDLSGMSAILDLRDGVVVAEPGALMGDIDTAARAALGQELRLHPSTVETASIGGFVAGGSGGVGSIRWGMLYEGDNIRRLQVVTMEASPRVVDVTGADIAQIHHAYGATGVISEVEVPLAPAPDWVEMVIGFDTWPATLEAGWALAEDDALWLKLVSAIEAPAPERYFKRHARFLAPGDHVLCVMAAPDTAEVVARMMAAQGGRIALRSDAAEPEDLRGLPHLYHLAWNHTTLRGLRMDPAITYLQIGFPDADPLAACHAIATRFAGEIIGHVEFTRSAGRPRISGLPLIRFASEDRLWALIRELEDMGCPVWNPHVYTLEEGGRRDADPEQRATKAAHDPKGLLNPGKMIGWERPDYRYDPGSVYAYPEIQPEPDT